MKYKRWNTILYEIPLEYTYNMLIESNFARFNTSIMCNILDVHLNSASKTVEENLSRSSAPMENRCEFSSPFLQLSVHRSRLIFYMLYLTYLRFSLSIPIAQCLDWLSGVVNRFLLRLTSVQLSVRAPCQVGSLCRRWKSRSFSNSTVQECGRSIYVRYFRSAKMIIDFRNATFTRIPSENIQLRSSSRIEITFYQQINNT